MASHGMPERDATRTALAAPRGFLFPNLACLPFPTTTYVSIAARLHPVRLLACETRYGVDIKVEHAY